jgi:hypothetical protein
MRCGAQISRLWHRLWRGGFCLHEASLGPPGSSWPWRGGLRAFRRAVTWASRRRRGWPGGRTRSRCRVLPPRAAAAADRRHQSGERRPYREQRNARRRPAGVRLRAARVRVPAIMVSSMARLKVAHEGPLGHGCTLEMIESSFGRQSLTAWDASAVDLRHGLRHRVPPEASRASSPVPGPPAPPPRSAAPPSSRFLRARRPRGKRGRRGAGPATVGVSAGGGMAGLTPPRAEGGAAPGGIKDARGR